jgi:hypothetical protein
VDDCASQIGVRPRRDQVRLDSLAENIFSLHKMTPLGNSFARAMEYPR